MATARRSEEQIFHALRRIDDPQERAVQLQEACAGDFALQERIEALLRASEQPDNLLDRTPAGWMPGVHTLQPAPPEEVVGTTIGRYRLLERIGEGGMGIVYMAEQTEPVRRKVALKVIKPGMDTRQVVARFDAERQALAMMEHPHIARVLDGGTTDERRKDEGGRLKVEHDRSSSAFILPPPSFSSGRPYFVMELIRGMPITEFCDRERLTVRQRLDLFVSVCQAVQHAHQKGIIHRDLKPANVMVTLHDGTPVPKVIDFGVAKALGGQLTERTLFTQFAQMVGTPLYMSPEQAALSGIDVDTRSDIYSLGVLLYELLTGTTPFDREQAKEAGSDALRRMICKDDPARPSARLSTLGEQLTTVSQQRRTDVHQLRRLLRGELDWIVMKALEKDRNRRYETANAFALDIERYLNDEPVDACPPSAVYRVRKFARRNTAALITFLMVSLVLLAGSALSTWQAVRAGRAERVAERRAAQATQAQWQAEQSRAEARRLLYVSDIGLAAQAVRDGDVPQAEELLSRHRPGPGEADLRGFEWHYLTRLIRVERRHLASLHTSLYCASYSPRGDRLAAAGADGVIRMYDMEYGRPPRVIDSGQIEVNGLAFSPGASLLASTGDDGTVRLWDTSSGRERLRIDAHPERAHRTLFVPGTELLISCGADPVIRLWDTRTGRPRGQLEGHERSVSAITVSPDGKLLASASSDRTAKVWDIESGREIRTLVHIGRVLAVAFSPDGRLLATGSLDKTLRIWEPASGKQVSSMSRVDGVQSLAFSPQGRALVVGDRGGAISLWRREGGQWPDEATPLRSWPVHDGRVYQVAFSPDGRSIVSAADDGHLVVSYPPAVEPRRGRELHEAFSDFAWISDCRIALADESGVAVLDAAGGDPLAALPLAGGCKVIVASPDSRLLATGDVEGTLRLWDLGASEAADATPRELWSMPRRPETVGEERWPSAVHFSPDGTRLAMAAYHAKSAWLFDTATGQLQMELPAQTCSSVAFSPDGRRIAVPAGDDVNIWDAQTGERLRTLRGHGSTVNEVAYSPDGRLIASSSNDRSIKLWDAASSAEQASLTGHRARVLSLAFSPDGRSLVSGSRDRSIRVWHIPTARPLMRLDAVDYTCVKLQFSPDGARLAAQLSELPFTDLLFYAVSWEHGGTELTEEDE